MTNFVSRFLRRNSLTRKQREYLSTTLHGDHPEQACWADMALRKHVLKVVAETFGGDWLWCMQATLALFFINPQSIDDVDRIIAEHVESRRGAFPATLYEGQGWNPANAANFDGEAPAYWRGYVAVGPDHWTLMEFFKNPAMPNYHLRQSGYRCTGTRGCVRQIEFSRTAEEATAGAFAEVFARTARGLVSNALGNAGPDELWRAVRGRTAYDGRSGPVHLRFVSETFQERGDQPQRSFRLMLDYES